MANRKEYAKADEKTLKSFEDLVADVHGKIKEIHGQIKEVMEHIQGQRAALTACRAATEAARKSRIRAENNGDRDGREKAFDEISASLELEKTLISGFEEYTGILENLKSEYSILRKTQYPELVKISDETKRQNDLQRQKVQETLVQLQNTLTQIYAVESTVTTKESPATDDQAAEI